MTPASRRIVREHLPFDLDRGITPRARIGLVVLSCDQTIEYEWRGILAGLPGVGLFHARIAVDPIITPDSLRAMEPMIRPTTELLLPGHRFDAVAFGCTSAAMVLGEERVIALMDEAKPEARATTPITAARIAMTALGARRIALLTPYRADVNLGIIRYLEARGLEVPVFGSFNEPDDGKVGQMTVGSIRQAVCALGREPGADAVFVSCTSIRLAAEAAAIEAELGKPVTSSNHAMAWHALRLAGVADPQPAFGRLFTCPLPAT
ncbi:maleate cis-trans isomerase family protein [Geminicoccus flavidas]|uniref:maleate cis-trans isomerase family protein n=1 Tax=Geminicoccus flavidas TaxID=2506407 RepID=UPI00135BDEC1|nr:Asp/Glu racemase [Geminicoccus flavidas]